MNKKYYFVLVLVLCASILLLGLSYSKESGISTYESIKVEEKDYKVIYSKKQVLTNDDNKIDINIINMKDESDYQVNLKLLRGNMEDISVIVDDEDEVPFTEVIKTGRLSKYGTDGDNKIYHIEIKSKKEFKVEVDVTFGSNEVASEVIDNEG
jgi:hypothetical protein